MKKRVLRSVVCMLCACFAAGCAGTGTKDPADLFPGQDVLPIVAWYSIPPADLTAERFQELKDAGFNISFTHATKHEDAVKALDLAAETGIRCIYMSDSMNENPEETVKSIMNHPGLAAYYLKDEPKNEELKDLGVLAKRVMDTDPSHTCYLNLFPILIYGKEYRQYVQNFTDTVPINLISFDYYPVVDGVLLADWYENLEIIAEESKRVNRPFWAFALSTAHRLCTQWKPYSIPNSANLRLQMYSNLAYGAQGLQYFTYWNPTTDTWDFHDAPITLDKKRSPVYDLVRELNQELQARAFVFAHAKMISVHHVGKEIPAGTKRLETLPPKVTKLDTNGGGAIVSLLEKNGRQYLMIVNRSLNDQLDLTITFEPGVMRIRRDGTKTPADKYVETLWLTPGDCEIFEL